MGKGGKPKKKDKELIVEFSLTECGNQEREEEEGEGAHLCTFLFFLDKCFYLNLDHWLLLSAWLESKILDLFWFMVELGFT